MAELNKTIEEIIDKRLGKYLQEAGFNRTDKTFVKHANDAIQLLCVEEMKSGFGNSHKFTICLGLYFPFLAQKLGIVASSDIPKETECHVRQRIGYLMPKKKDHWWMVIKPVIDLDGVAVEVKDTVAKYAFAWFDRFMLLDGEEIIQGARSDQDSPIWH